MNKIGFHKNDIAKLQDEYINIPLDFRHAMIVGQTGCGKTTSAILPAIKDRLEKGHGVLVFDYKGVEHQKIKKLALDTKRLKDVYMLNAPWGVKVNIVKEANFETIVREIKQGYLYAGERNHYFTQNATSYFSNVLMMLIEVEKISNVYMKFNKKIDCLGIPTPNIKEVLNILQSEESYGKFCKNINTFYKKYVDVKLTSFMNEDIVQNQKNKLYEHMPVLLNTKETMILFIAQNSDYIETNRSSNNDSFDRNIASMITSLNKLAYMDCLNTDGTSLANLLNEGKIIIVNTEDFDETMLSLLLNSVLENLTRRKISGQMNGISIFIDEAQKVLNRHFDLHTDVLREANCEIILSFQNADLMINKIGLEKYQALFGNLCSKYYFKNEMHPCQNLDEFECYIPNGNKKVKFKPIFFNDDELLQAEYKYQYLNKVIPNFAVHKNQTNHILVYKTNDFKTKNKLVYKDIKSGTEEEVGILTSEDKKKIDEEIGRITRRINSILDS